MSTAYIAADQREEEASLRTWQDDLILERMAGELLEDPVMIASALSDLDEESRVTKRLATALHSLYHDYTPQGMAPNAMLAKAALYAVIKDHCKAVMGNF